MYHHLFDILICFNGRLVVYLYIYIHPFPQVGPGGGCFSFGGTVQYIEESNIYLCFVVCRLKRGLVT